MADLTTIATVLSSIKTASEIASAIKLSMTSLEQAEVNFKLAELVGALADAKMNIADIQTEILNRDTIIRELTEKIEVQKTLLWEKPYYWAVIDGGKEGPFCQHCYDTARQLVRLQGGEHGAWRCQACKNTVTDKDYVKPSNHLPGSY